MSKGGAKGNLPDFHITEIDYMNEPHEVHWSTDTSCENTANCIRCGEKAYKTTSLWKKHAGIGMYGATGDGRTQLIKCRHCKCDFHATPTKRILLCNGCYQSMHRKENAEMYLGYSRKSRRKQKEKRHKKRILGT